MDKVGRLSPKPSTACCRNGSASALEFRELLFVSKFTRKKLSENSLKSVRVSHHLLKRRLMAFCEFPHPPILSRRASTTLSCAGRGGVSRASLALFSSPEGLFANPQAERGLG